MADVNGLSGGTAAPAPVAPPPPSLKDVLKSTIVDTAVKQFMAWAVSKLPFLGWAGINPVVGWIVGFVVEKLLDYTILGANEAWIAVNEAADVKAVKDASATLQNLPDDATPEQIAAAKAAFEKAAGDLITIPDAPF